MARTRWHPTIIKLHSVSSTQRWARDWAQMGARDGLIIIAREQTAGRGRMERVWESRPGGLYLSLLLRPAIPVARANQLTMLVSLAAIDACQQVAGVQAAPKWPNDLLLADKKLAGVLTELESSDGCLRFAVIGLGLNVNNAFDSSPLADIATSLRMATGRSYDVDAVAAAFIEALAERYEAFRAGVSPHRAWAAHLQPLGRRVRVHSPPQAPLCGLAEDVSPEGALLVRDDAGALHTVWAGDVVIE